MFFLVILIEGSFILIGACDNVSRRIINDGLDKTGSITNGVHWIQGVSGEVIVHPI
jgi:hypothetical protein